jgi:hypothetical protein
VALGLEGAVVARPSVEAQWGATIFGYLWEEGELRPAMWRLLPRRVAMVTGFAPGTGAKRFYTCTSVTDSAAPDSQSGRVGDRANDRWASRVSRNLILNKP